MHSLIRKAGLGVSIAGLVGTFALAETPNQPIDGRWDAHLIRQGKDIPFRLDIATSGGHVQGTLYNGFQPYDGTTDASFRDGKLTLEIEHYLTTINATLKDGELVGDVDSHSRAATAKYEFHATRHVENTSSGPAAPSIAGLWRIPLDSPSSKGEKAFHFIVEQRGNEVAASILRVDGDTGAYSGTYKDGRWVLSHFDGSRPGVIVVTPAKDGTLEIVQGDNTPQAAERSSKAETSTRAYNEEPADSRYTPHLIAYRSETARAKGLPEPENYETHTTVRDPKEKFTFNFPDVNGKLVSSEDPRFKGKVVLAIVTGTWCPNCHDEAQYLVQLDKKYRSRGLAIVALDFEEPEQQNSLAREKAFVKKYGVDYTYLIAGAPAEMWEKIPQAVNLNTWPATIFVGRDGLVKGIHSGFASPASGEFHSQLQKEFESKIEQLLKENASESLASSTATAKQPGQ